MTTDVRTVRAGPWSARYKSRMPRVLLATAAVGVVLAVAGLLVGSYGLTPAEALGALVGRSEDRLAAYFVREVRAPRVAGALVVGAALGVAGSLLQNVTVNPLGSPDILGFTTGAASGALVQIIVVGSSSTQVALGALVGGLATALLVHLLTRPTGLTSQRLVLVGLGVGVTLAALNSLLIVRASLVAAQTAAQWLAGSLNAVLWPRVGLTATAVGVLLILAALLARPVAMLPLGDDYCRAAGIPVPLVRQGAVLVSVALVSVATAATGPIAFVALAAPQISRRLMRQPMPGVVGSAVTGGVLVLVSDLIAQRLFAPTQLAVGVVTGAAGGVYLVWLLATEWGRSRR